MIICLCNGLSDRHIKEACEKSCPKAAEEVFCFHGCESQCGSCLEIIEDSLKEKSKETHHPKKLDNNLSPATI